MTFVSGRGRADALAELARRPLQQVEHHGVRLQPARHEHERLRPLLLADHLDAVLGEHVDHAQPHHRLEVPQQHT